MRRLWVAFAVVVAVVWSGVQQRAEAQVISVYGTFAPVRVSQPQTSFWANGFGGGVTLNFLPLPVVSLGLDLRGSSRSGVPGADTALVGLKLGVHPPLLRIKPYIQASAGYLGYRSASSVTDKELMYEVLGGLDYPLVHFVDFRVIEIGGGQVVNGTNGQNPSVLTINTGLVVHF